MKSLVEPGFLLMKLSSSLWQLQPGTVCPNRCTIRRPPTTVWRGLFKRPVFHFCPGTAELRGVPQPCLLSANGGVDI